MMDVVGPLLTVLSFGGGQDSTFILYKLITDPEYRKRFAPHRLVVLMADTGNEHPHTYKHVEFCRQLCEQNNIEFYFLGDEWKSKSWQGGLKGHYYRYNNIMSKMMGIKSCTHQLKIQPIYKFIATYVNDQFLGGMFRPENKQSLKVFAERYGKIRVLLGISSEEAGRRIGKIDNEALPVYMKLCIDKVYPMVMDGVTRSDCQQEIKKLGLPLPFPSNCIWCPFLSKRELIWLHRNLPEELEELKQREAAKLLKFSHVEKNYGVFSSKTIDEVLAAALVEFGHLSDEELNDHKLSHGHCVTSSY